MRVIVVVGPSRAQRDAAALAEWLQATLSVPITTWQCEVLIRSEGSRARR